MWILRFFLEVSANQKMKSLSSYSQSLEIVSAPVPNLQTSGDRSYSLATSHELQKKRFYTYLLLFEIGDQVKKISSNQCSEITVQTPFHFSKTGSSGIMRTCSSPDPASHPIFAFLQVFPWYSETSCALQAKVNFLARYWGGKSGRNFRYARQPVQFTFSDHPYIERGLWVVFQAGLNNFTSEVMCAAALGFQFHFLDCFSYVQVKTIVPKWKDYVIDGKNVE